MPRPLPDASVTAMLAREQALYIQRKPVSRRLSEQEEKNWLRGVPMHWMVDWATPSPGGYARAHGLDPEALMLCKPIAGGIPAAVYGFTAGIGQRIREYLRSREPGHSGIGTILSCSRIQLALMRAVLESYMTQAAFASLLSLAEKLESGRADVIARRRLDWHAVRVGTRVEFMCCPNRPRNGGEAAKLIQRQIDRAVHHYLLNRGIVVTPFHNMLLIRPATRGHHVDRLVETLDRCSVELSGSGV